MRPQRPHLICAAATPLAPDLRCDRRLLVAHCHDLLWRGCDGIALFGTTGEGPTLPVAERQAVLEHVLDQGIGPDRLIAACGSASPHDAIDLARHALSVGVERILLMPPFFLRAAASEAGVGRFYAEVIERVAHPRLRLLLYHYPEVAGIGLSVAGIQALRAAHGEQILGIKDSGGDWRQTAALLDAFPELMVYTGTELHARRATARGGAGTICGLANLVPELLRALLDATGDAQADALIRALQAFDDQVCAEGFLRTTKAVIAARAGEDGWRRVMPPLAPATAEAGRVLAEALPGASGSPGGR